MDKKALKKQWKEEQERKFEASLPMSREEFECLFDFLDARETCNHNLEGTIEYLESKGIASEPVIEWLREQGGYCDCEVMVNVAPKIEDGDFF